MFLQAFKTFPRLGPRTTPVPNVPITKPITMPVRSTSRKEYILFCLPTRRSSLRRLILRSTKPCFRNVRSPAYRHLAVRKIPSAKIPTGSPTSTMAGANRADALNVKSSNSGAEPTTPAPTPSPRIDRLMGVIAIAPDGSLVLVTLAHSWNAASAAAVPNATFFTCCLISLPTHAKNLFGPAGGGFGGAAPGAPPPPPPSPAAALPDERYAGA